MNEQRVSDWTLEDTIERLEASGPDSTFLVGPMDKLLVLTTFRELEERRKLDVDKQAVLSRDGAIARVSSDWLTVEILRANCEGKTWHEHSRNVWLAMVELDQHRVDAVRRADQRCETCASFYEAGPGAWWAKGDHLCSEHRDYDDYPRSVRATDGCCWHMPKEEPQPCP